MHNDISSSNMRKIKWNVLSDMMAVADDSLSGGLFFLTDDAWFESDTVYNGLGATVVFANEIRFTDSSNVLINNLHIEGNITLYESSSNISFKDCEIKTNETAIINYSKDLSLYSCTVNTGRGIVSYADGLAVEDCDISTDECSLSIFGADSVVRSNLISVGAGSIGIDVCDGASNTLVAQNTVKGTDSSIRVKGSLNCVLILNNVKCIEATDSVSLYVVNNAVSDTITLFDNSFLLCDSNKLSKLTNAVIAKNNSNTNGDNITDVTQRTVGACEDILPHTNKDLFLDMTRKTRVRDSHRASSVSLHEYIAREAKSHSIVIVPPGAYAENEMLELGKTHSNTVIYAYGVYDEFARYDVILTLACASEVELHGLTLGYRGQSSGQIHFLKKLEDNKMLAVSAAGYTDGYGSSDPDVFSTSTSDLFVGDKLYPEMTKHGSISVGKNGDGTLLVSFSDTEYYDRTAPGDIHACRMAGGNKRTVLVRDSENILFRDIVLYGYSAAIAFGAFGKLENVRLERFHNTVHSPTVIDAATYERYKLLEECYGVDLEVYVDAQGRFRGATPRVGSVDATHISTATHGVSLTSCLLESMCDDGSNQHATSSRLHAIEDGENGEVVLYIKSCLSEVYYNKGLTRGGHCGYISSGDRLLIYTSEGKLFCDTLALSDQAECEPIVYYMEFRGERTKYSADLIAVKVLADEIDRSSLIHADGTAYDLSDNGYLLDNKVFVDNLSLNSADFTFDNVLVRNTRSRGMLIKTSGATVKHSTFRNLGFTGLLLNSEPRWGESTIARDVTVSKCLFDNLGFMDGGYWHKIYASIAIGAPITSVSENSIICKDFTIEGCKFTGSKNIYGITVSGAQNIKIKNNVFESVSPHGEKEAGVAIDIDGALNVEISDNRYWGDTATVIHAKNYKKLCGSDVEGIFPQSDAKE